MDLRELYQEVILDHNKKPRNFHALESATHQCDGYNPLCGDRVTVFAIVEDDKISDLSFLGSGCAISTASASMLTEAIKGQSLEKAQQIFKNFHRMLTQEVSSEEREALGKLEIFAGVREFPTRVKCATLVWHTLTAALAGNNDEASTE